MVLITVLSVHMSILKKHPVPCAAAIENDKQNTKPSFVSTETHTIIDCIAYSL